MEQFATYGYEGARAETIAAAAGVSKGALFGYFGSKAGLFLAAYQAATRTFSRVPGRAGRRRSARGSSRRSATGWAQTPH